MNRPPLVDRIFDWYYPLSNSRRPPYIAAKILARIVELHKANKPFPTYRDLGDELSCSEYTVSSTLNIALERGIITIEIGLEPGNIQQRANVIKRRFYIPSDELLAI